MKSLIFKIVIPLTIISFAIFTKWWYASPVDAPDTMFTGFPFPFVCNGWHTSLSLQIFVIEFIADLLIYFLFWFILVFCINRFVVKLKVHKVVTICLWALSCIIVVFATLLAANKDNLVYTRRPFGMEVLETGFKLGWQHKERPGFYKYQAGKQPSTIKNNKKDTSLVIKNQGDDRWNFRRYLNDPATPQLAKDIFNSNWKFKDEEALSYLEKLHGPDKEARPFYFRVVTNSYAKADGAYAEGLGDAGYNYVERYPNEFSQYFIGQNAFTDKDLQTWADIVILEIEIEAENKYDQPLIKDYIDALRKNCKDCSVQQRELIEKFGRYLNERWLQYLKHIDK